MGQIYPNTNFSVKEGLINSNAYAISQDRAGFIWVGTENGFSRFDGVEFNNISLEELQLGSYISSICIAPDNKVIFGNGDNNIYSYDFLAHQLIQINKSVVSLSNQLILHDSILISLHEYHVVELISYKTGKLIVDDFISSTDLENKPLSILKLRNNRILIGRKSGLYELIGTTQKKLDIAGVNDLPVYSIFENQNGSLLLGTDGEILQLHENELMDKISVIQTKEKRVRNIITDNQNNIWFNVWGTSNLYMISKGNIVNVSETIGTINASVSRVFNDRDGNIWAGTIGKGIYLFTNKQFLIYPLSKSFPNANINKFIRTTNDDLFLGSTDGIAYLNALTGTIFSMKHMPEMTQYVRDLVAVNDSEYVVAITDIRLTEPLSKAFSLEHNNGMVRYAHGSSLASEKNQLFVGNWDNCILVYDMHKYKLQKRICNIFPNSYGKLRINSLFFDSDGKLWVGSEKGLCILNDAGDKHFPDGDIQNIKVNSIAEMNSNEILVTTINGYVIYENHKNIQSIKENRKENISNTTCFAFTGNQEYLAGTSNGLVFKYHEKEINLSIHDGVLSENITDIKYTLGDLYAWVATTEGILRVSMDVLRKSMTESPVINYITVKHEDSTYVYKNAPLQFDFSGNVFSIQFSALYFKNPHRLIYQYNINDGQWIIAPSAELQFASLDPGSHRVNIRAGLDDKNWGPVSNVTFYIAPPFYRTWWFYLLTFSMGVFLIVYFFKHQLKLMKNKQDEKAKTKQKLVELQQKALASNLNPHFVFNSLNSIQHFINTNNKESANDYLAKFARLMRMHLNMADKAFISLHEEISRLEFYLSLEQMRFSDKLIWNIQIDENIDTYHMEIPNMIIQPFVENAIWHGIMPSKNKGKVMIRISMNHSKQMEIMVADNGVGFNPKPIDSNHESKGVKLIRDRLALMDASSVNTILFQQSDPGTMVRIVLTSRMYRVKRELDVNVS